MEGVALVKAISEAISEVSGLIRELVSGAEVRKLKYRVEAAINYVQVDGKEGEYEGITDKKQKSLKVHFRKRIFDV
jgi:hypothetical protein